MICVLSSYILPHIIILQEFIISDYNDIVLLLGYNDQKDNNINVMDQDNISKF